MGMRSGEPMPAPEPIHLSGEDLLDVQIVAKGLGLSSQDYGITVEGEADSPDITIVSDDQLRAA